MYKFIAATLTSALLTSLTAVNAQDSVGDGNAKTQGQIMRERSQACEGLKDMVLRKCLDNYVGPTRDVMSADADSKDAPEKSAAPEKSTAPEKSATPDKSPASQKAGHDAAKGGEHGGSSDVDMTTATKRGPVGPMRKPEPSKQ